MSIADDFNNLDPSNPSSWPFAIKSIVYAAVFAVILVLGWQFDIAKKADELVQLENKTAEQLAALREKQKKSANIGAMQEQMREMEQSLDDLVRQLPNETEVAGLLVDISQTGLGAGLEFKLFQPNQENPKEFYAELPISISVIGDYHQFGEFISGIAKLPRIVTTHNIIIEPLKIESNEDSSLPLLEMKAIAKTYRALEDKELNNAE